ncbi:hypothetical protein, partial [Burkholderia gladioli]|uniref:hypothetical protein n=1 Tax=Burkholderia gladioli TaxID=28095 RepID=UPI00163FA9CB
VPAPDGWKLVPIERSYDMRVKALLAFNTTEKETNDRDDALDAAHRAMLDAAPAAPVAEAGPQWLPINLAPDDDELIWLMKGDSIEGPRRIHPNDYDRYTHYAPCEAPNIKSIAAQAVAADGAAAKVKRTSNGLWALADEMDANGWKDDALTLRLLLSAHDVDSVVSMMKALQFIDSELTEYLEGMPADETSRKLRDVARNALNVERAAVPPATAEERYTVATFDDGLKVRLDSWTGGRHEAGSFGEVALRFTDERRTTVRDYRAKDIAPAEAREPHYIAKLDFGEGLVVVQECTLDDAPSIAIYGSLRQGTPGESAKAEPSPTDPEIARRSVFLTFLDSAHRDRVADALVGAPADAGEAALSHADAVSLRMAVNTVHADGFITRDRAAELRSALAPFIKYPSEGAQGGKGGEA